MTVHNFKFNLDKAHIPLLVGKGGKNLYNKVIKVSMKEVRNFKILPDNFKGPKIEIKHIGNVIIGNYVDIGSNTTIDKGTLNSTIIGYYCRIDNLVHIAHNVYIGKGSVICGQSGVAGSTHIGENVIIGAQVGISGHLHIKSGTILSARSGVTKDITKAELMGGFPAVPIKEFRKQKAILSLLTKNKIRKKT